MKRAIACLLLGLGWGAAAVKAQSLEPSGTPVIRDYQFHRIPEPELYNSPDAPFTIENGVLRLTVAQLIAAVVANNLTIASARYYPSMAKTDLLRARSGASPRGVDASQIPSGVFAGAEGGSILGTAGSSGGGSSNAGGITGSAGRVSIRPSGLFDPSISANFSLDRTSSPLNTLVVAGVPSVTNRTLALSLNYAQAFATGTSFTVSYGLQRQASTQLHLLFNPYITPGVTATVSQQVLNGFGSAVNRALINVAQNEQKIEREAFRQQVTAALISAQNAYWDLAATQGTVRSAKQALDVAQQLAQNNREQVRIGTMANLDVVTAEAQVAAAQRDLTVAQAGLQTAELQLKSMFSKNLDDALAAARIEIADPFPDPDSASIPALERAVQTAMANRPEISIAQGNLKSQEDAGVFIRNALLPNLNVFALVTTVGLYDVFGTSFTEAVHFKYPEVAFGLTLSFPLHNRQAQADDVRSRLEKRQAEDTLVRSKSSVEVDVENAIIALKQSQGQVLAARLARRLESEKYEAERQKLAAGISTSYNLILAQRDLLAAELAEMQALDAYAKAGLSVDLSTGVVLEKCHVNLDQVLRRP